MTDDGYRAFAALMSAMICLDIACSCFSVIADITPSQADDEVS
jgi:hypothetical protein